MEYKKMLGMALLTLLLLAIVSVLVGTGPGEEIVKAGQWGDHPAPGNGAPWNNQPKDPGPVVKAGQWGDHPAPGNGAPWNNQPKG